ncbi:hypothetical protein [Glutamicibacter sp. X7]
MAPKTMNVIGIVGGLVLVGLNITAFWFFTLWQAADSAAINRMESASGMETTQMLPNANQLWVAAHGTVLMLLVLDLLALFAVASLAGARRRGLDGRRLSAKGTPDTERRNH